MDEGTRNRRLTTCYFFVLGIGTYCISVIVVVLAIEDILAGTLWPTAVVLVSFSVPDILAKIFSPFIVSKMSFAFSFGLSTVLYVGSILFLVAIDDVRLRIVGVALHGMAYGYSTITCVRMISYYEQPDVFVIAFQNGNNAALLLASLGYTGATTWLCVAPRAAMAACFPICFLPIIIYCLLDKEPLKDHLRQQKIDQQDKKYTILPRDEGSEHEVCASTKSMSKPVFLLKVFPTIAYTYVTNLCQHFIMTSVLSTLTFPSSPFRPRDHYQYYRFNADTGSLLGGLWSIIAPCAGTRCTELCRIRRIWIPVLVNVILLVFFLFATWYRFLHSVAVVLVLCFTQGLVFGLTLVNCAANTATLFPSTEDKGTALGLMELAFSTGRIVAGLFGIFAERYLREHCTNRLLLGVFCLAREASHAQWNANIECTR